MKTILKYTLFLLIAIVLIGGCAIFSLSEKEPLALNESSVSEADILADKMMASVNKQAWDDTKWVQWTFKGVHSFLWDKERNWCKVSWGKGSKEVLLKMNEIAGKAFIDGVAQDTDKNEKMVQTAWSHFCNDSFWLNAIVKAKDPGTERSIVELDDGRKGLKVQYTSGGVTPGDSYVWILDENNRPTSYKMWVKIIPIGGLEFTWEDYVELESGAVVASLHKSKLLNLDITDLKSGESYRDFGLTEDPFKVLNK